MSKQRVFKTACKARQNANRETGGHHAFSLSRSDASHIPVLRTGLLIELVQSRAEPWNQLGLVECCVSPWTPLRHRESVCS